MLVSVKDMVYLLIFLKHLVIVILKQIRFLDNTGVMQFIIWKKILFYNNIKNPIV